MEYTLENDEVKCVIKQKGAELASFYNKSSNVEHMWQADPAVWGRHAPVLFPIVGQVEDNEYKVGNKRYNLSQHGFARDKDMELVFQTSSDLVFSLKYDEETLAKYPFKFELKITYTLSKNSLSVGYEVINLDDDTIWFSIGAHPGFACPFNENESFSDYHIKFNREETADRLLFADGLLTGEVAPFLKNEAKINLSHELFKHDAIIFEQLQSTSCVLESSNHEHGLRFDFNGFPFLAFWTKPGANAPYLCIEPWYGIADTRGEYTDYREKKGIQKLVKGGVFEASYALTSF